MSTKEVGGLKFSLVGGNPYALFTISGIASPASRYLRNAWSGLMWNLMEVGKVRKFQNMSATSFWSANRRPMSATQFLESLFGVLPEFFKNEDELRAVLSSPETCKELLAELAEKGLDREMLGAMQTIIDGENRDLFDVLAFVAFAADPVTRAQRAEAANVASATEFTDKQTAFVDFVLAQYIVQALDELDQEKLSSLLKLKYKNALAVAFAELGKPEQVRRVFVDFQKYLYASSKGGHAESRRLISNKVTDQKDLRAH